MENPMLDTRVDGLYRLVKGRVDWDNIIPTCLEVAQELEQMHELKGAQRLELLQKTMRFALREAELPKEKKEHISFFINTVLPIAMQAAILASKVPIKSIAQSCCWKK